MNFALNAITAPDAYGDAATLENLPVLDHVNLDVANQAIFWQVKQTSALSADTAGSWSNEVYMLPGSRTISRAGVIGVRVRAAIAAGGLPAGSSQAVVTVEAVES